MKVSLHYYLIKSPLASFAPVLKRVLELAAMRRDHKQIVKDLDASEPRWGRVVESANDSIFAVKAHVCAA